MYTHTHTHTHTLLLQRDMKTFAVEFVAETNLRSLSVKDVKDAVGEALGGVGVSFIPQVYVHIYMYVYMYVYIYRYLYLYI